MMCPQGNAGFRIGLLSNPLSGRNRRRFLSFRALFQANPVLEYAEVTTPDDIKKALTGFAAEQVNLVLINGGDGTIQATLNSLMNDRPFPKLPRLAVLPAGTANLIAGDVGMGPLQLSSVDRFIRAARSPSPSWGTMTRHILRIRFPGGALPLHGMFFGLGAVYHGAQVGRETKRTVGRLGEWGAGLILTKFLFALAGGSRHRLNPVSVGVSTEGVPLEYKDYLGLFVTTLDRLFLGMKPFWNVPAGPLHCTGLTVPYRYLWWTLPALLRGKPHPLATTQHGFFSKNVQAIKLRFTSGFVLDGEVYEPPPFQEPLVLESAGEITFIRFPAHA